MASSSAGDKTITGYLKRIIGSPVGEVITLTDSDISIGRTKKSDICIHDPNISRSHCTLNYSVDGWFITDLGGVNGTYLDTNKLMPQIPQPLKDGSGIYLGPPEEAPVAFVFIKNKVKESPIKPQECLQSKKESINGKIEDRLQSDQPTLKRRANINSHSSRSKKHAPSTSSHQPVSSQSTTDGQDSDNNSNISISSLDSLRTRIRKMNSHKKKKHSPNTRDNLNIPSTSASLCVRPSAPKFDCLPSTSSGLQVTKPSGKSSVSEKLKKSMTAGVFRELETLFDDGSDSLIETANLGEGSENLLNDSMLLSNAGPDPFSQSLDAELPCGANQGSEASMSDKSQRKKKKKILNEQLKKAHVKLLKENSEQKQKLNQFIKASTSKKEPSEKLGEMLEEELICNICTEVFIKATTLGCSHTFCEHCITEWKKKQKRCPMCREMITSETRILIMDNFIDKVVEKLDKDYQDKRKEVIASREAAKVNAKVKKAKRKKSSRSRSSRRTVPSAARAISREGPDELREWRLSLLNEVPFHVREMSIVLSSESDMEDHFPHCFICGDPGHLTTNCPNGW